MVNASTVDTVVNGAYTFGGNASYTTRNYIHNSGNATGVNNTNLYVRGDADIYGGMVRPNTMTVDGTFTIHKNGTGHANNLITRFMAPIQSGGVDMILNHRIEESGYTILEDAFVKACKMPTAASEIAFGTEGSVFQIQRNGIFSTLENILIINGEGVVLDIDGYYLTDHNVNPTHAQDYGFSDTRGMTEVTIDPNSAVLVLGERQQYYFNSGEEAFDPTQDNVLLRTANGGTIDGMFSNVRRLTSDSWGYSSYFGDFELAIRDGGEDNDVLAITKFTRSEYTSYVDNQTQLAKMGLNPKASTGVLQNLQNLTLDIVGVVAGTWGKEEMAVFGLSYDAGQTAGYGEGVMRVAGDSEDAHRANIAGRLNRDMYSAVVNGSLVFQTNRDTAPKTESSYVGFINGRVDAATWDYMNGATVNNVVRANQRAMLTASDMVYDRLAGYGFAAQNVYAAVGSDYGLASAVLNAKYLNRFWVSGIGQWDDADDRGGFAGYQYDSYGFATGYDRALGAFILGGSFAYTTGDYEDDYASGHDSDIDNYAFNLYASYNHCSGLFATLVGGYTYSDNDINEHRGGHWTGQSFHTNTWYVSGKVGYNWRPVQGLTLAPSVGLGYIHSRASAHDGIYAGITNQRFGRMEADSGFVPVELRVNYDWCVGAESTFGLNAKAGYTYNFDADAASGNVFLYGVPDASPIRAVGRDMGHSAWNLGVGAKYTYKRFDFGVNYDYVGLSDFDSHRLTASVGIGF